MNGPTGMAMNPAAGGPVGAAQMNAQQQTNPAIMPSRDMQTRLNTYIYDHFIRTKQWDLARQFVKNNHVRTVPKVNGVSMDSSSKDSEKKPFDLQDAELPPHHGDVSFLWDWFSMFWDTFNAAKQSPITRPLAQEYVAQQKQRSELAANRDPKFISMSMQQRMAATNMKLNMGNRPQSMTQEQQRKMMAQNMQRDPSNMDMTGQRPSTPGGSIDNAPSPSKKPRLDNGGGFEGPGMGPGGRPMGNPMMQNGMADAQMSAFGPNGQPKLEGMNGMQPGQLGSGMDNLEYLQNARNIAGNSGDGRHALQDYQMQLMLLEQQNKKRLLQARREQDNITNHMQGPGPGHGGAAGNNPIYAPNMSPSGSRGAGPSPNPAEQIKRGTPKIPQAGLPGSPMPDMQQRGSPGAPNFDPSNGTMPQGMPQQFFSQMGGMRQPPSSHPQFPLNVAGMNPQQLEQMQRMAQANNGRLPNGQPWPPGVQNPGMQAGPGNQPGPAAMGTPQSRGNMAPPPAPADAQPPAQQRPQESSPAQPAAPPTPSQSNKANPKKKEPAKKKNAAKKQNSTTAATPTESAEPATSTPATPMTPMPRESFSKASGQPTANPSQAPPAAQISQPAVEQNTANNPLFGAPSTLTDDPGFTLDFADVNSVDVLEGFDFDSFLQTDDTSLAMGDFNFDNGVEAGAGNV